MGTHILNYPKQENIQRFEHVLLDKEGYLYSFHNDIPVYLQGSGLSKVGIARLALKRKKLYAVLLLHKYEQSNYEKLYPHLLHNVKGHVFAILLSGIALLDTSIGSLQE